MKGFTNLNIKKASLVAQMVKNLPAMQETWFNPTPVFLHGEFHGQMILAGYSPWGCRVGTLLSTDIYSTRLQTLGKILKKKKRKRTLAIFIKSIKEKASQPRKQIQITTVTELTTQVACTKMLIVWVP